MTEREGRMAWDGHETWYRVVGDLESNASVPVVVCHGGPGAAHDYCEAIADLNRFGRACVLYDQIGCGKSQHLPDAPAGFWTPQLFKDELDELTRHLGIADRYAVVGQSWGGMLAMEHALDHPAGLRGIVVADSPASMTLWVSEANRLREDLPPDVQSVLTKHEEAGTTDDPEYETAVRVFYDRHLCRVPWPDGLQRSFDQMADDPTVYHTMNGPSEFHVIGSLKGWDITDRLHEISHADAARLGSPRRGDSIDRRGDPRTHSRCRVDDLRAVEPPSAHRGARALPRRVERFLQTID